MASEPSLAQILDAASDPATLLKLLPAVTVITATLTALHRLSLAILVPLGHTLRFYFRPAIAQQSIKLSINEAITDSGSVNLEGTKLYCQLVRFGADEYLAQMATPQEKFEGRLQNKVLPVTIHQDGDDYSGKLIMPVHRVLGTQFRMFIVTPTEHTASQLIDTKLFSNPARFAKQQGNRISFVLLNMQTVGNVEHGSVNNVIYPSHLPDFVEYASFSKLYQLVQRLRLRAARKN